MLRQSITRAVATILFCTTFWTLFTSESVAFFEDDLILSANASGDGSFYPLSGYFFGSGENTDGSVQIDNGLITSEPIGDPANGLFRFENTGRGTEEEVFQETIHVDGSSLSTRFSGKVQLVPLFDDQGNPTGQFTAVWNGVWQAVKGTGRYRGVQGRFRVTAINEPFNPTTDYVWNYTWTSTGNLRVPKSNATTNPCISFSLTTGGFGAFSPANLGQGDPAVFPFPLIIGDGSGAGIYDGTPTGNEFRLNGFLIGNGSDQHFGNAQSIAPGVFLPSQGKFRYPGRSGENPDGSGREIHIMQTLIGEIWFTYQHYFELDPAAGTVGVITGLADFRVVGGTGIFTNARGSVWVQVVSDLANFDPGDPSQGIPSSAPFRYDFSGFLEYCLFDE